MSNYTRYNTAYIITGTDWVSPGENMIKDFLADNSKPYEAVIIKPLSSISKDQNIEMLSVRSQSTPIESISELESSNSSISSIKTQPISQNSDNNFPDQKLIEKERSSTPVIFYPEKNNRFQYIQQTWDDEKIKNKETKDTANEICPILDKILNSTSPIDLNLNENEAITVQGETGVLANKSDIVNWSGPVPLNEYPINEDQTPEIIRKKTEKQLKYTQEIAIRYLRPPTPPPPGDIVIKQEKNFLPPPAPPIVIRQQPPRPETPQPLVIREAPPKPLPKVETKIITIPGKRLPPPPRKVIIERLPPLPSKPQSIIVERWLPFKEQKRKVVFIKPSEPDAFYEKPKNVIIQWESPSVTVNREYKDLGIVTANPAEYVFKYGDSLKRSDELPDFAKKIKPSDNTILASDFVSSIEYDLEGDLEALLLIDLDKEGLSEYKKIIENKKVGKFQDNLLNSQDSNTDIKSILDEIVNSIKMITAQTISYNEAKLIINNLKKKLNLNDDEIEANNLLKSINLEPGSTIDLKTFKTIFLKNLNLKSNNFIKI